MRSRYIDQHSTTRICSGRPSAATRSEGASPPFNLVDGQGRPAGFEVERTSKPYNVRFDHHPKPPLTPRNALHAVGVRAVTGAWAPGVLHRAALARPRV